MTPALALEDAQQRLLALAQPLGAETIAISDALGRTLAQDVCAVRTQPAADLSAMDGYALCGEGPWTVTGESRAGHPFLGDLKAGQAARISTGAVMPSGAETVLLQEDTARSGDVIDAVGTPPAPGAHIRRSGFDFRAGDTLLCAGARITPAAIAVGLSGGLASVEVTRRPRAVFIDTGDELAQPGTPCAAHQIPASNSAMLAALAAQIPCDITRTGPVPDRLDALVDAIRGAKRPLIVAGGGVRYSQAEAALAALAEASGIPVAETQAGKGALSWQHPRALGSIGVTGSTAANAAAQDADLIVGIGTRLQDFTTGSRSLFSQNAQARRLFQVNVQPFDAHKHGAEPVVGDALAVIESLSVRLRDWCVPEEVVVGDRNAIMQWNQAVDAATAGNQAQVMPSDAQVIGAVQRSVCGDAVVVCAAGGLPGELHKLWRTSTPGGYHLEYGFSCMGYEIAGGLGVKMAEPQREVVVMVGDGSYLMMNSELATSVMLGHKLIVVLLDNRGYGCINRLQQATGSPGFNNLLADSLHEALPDINFAGHARSLGALAEHVANLGELSAALVRARAADRSYVVVIDTDPLKTTEAGGWWWDVAVPEVSDRPEVKTARRAYEDGVRKKRDLS